MKFRFARHTNNLEPIIQFYTEIIGLEILGDFKDHDGYNGVFLGIHGKDWHLEFTQSESETSHIPDEDDLLVFYVESEKELADIQQRGKRYKIPMVEAKNPYWNNHGITLLDPDQFRVVISI